MRRVETRELLIKGQPGLLKVTVSRNKKKINKIKNRKMAVSISMVNLASTCKVLSSVPRTTKRGRETENICVRQSVIRK